MDRPHAIVLIAGMLACGTPNAPEDGSSDVSAEPVDDASSDVIEEWMLCTWDGGFHGDDAGVGEYYTCCSGLICFGDCIDDGGTPHCDCGGIISPALVQRPTPVLDGTRASRRARRSHSLSTNAVERVVRDSLHVKSLVDDRRVGHLSFRADVNAGDKSPLTVSSVEARFSPSSSNKARSVSALFQALPTRRLRAR